jgi:hypothetical protein
VKGNPGAIGSTDRTCATDIVAGRRIKRAASHLIAKTYSIWWTESTRKYNWFCSGAES